MIPGSTCRRLRALVGKLCLVKDGIVSIMNIVEIMISEGICWIDDYVMKPPLIKEYKKEDYTPGNTGLIIYFIRT